MGLFAEFRMPSGKTWAGLTCREAKEEFARQVMARENAILQKEGHTKLRIMYWKGCKPRSTSAGGVRLTELPDSDDLARDYITWRGDYEHGYWGFWWADFDRPLEGACTPTV